MGLFVFALGVFIVGVPMGIFDTKGMREERDRQIISDLNNEIRRRS